MKDITLLNPKVEPQLRWLPPVDFSFLSNAALLPVHASECGRVAASLPLAVIKDSGQASGWSLVAVCGSAPGVNNLVAGDGKWIGVTAPACVHYLPFTIKEFGGNKGLSAIDKRYADKLMATDEEGAPLYDQHGSLHPLAKKRTDFLSQLFPKIRRTQTVLKALNDAGLFVSWPEAVKRSGGISHKELFTIDEKALMALEEKAFLALRKLGALAVAYSCLLSLFQVRNLNKSQGSSSNSPHAMQSTGDLDLEFLNDSETIRFGPLQ